MDSGYHTSQLSLRSVRIRTIMLGRGSKLHIEVFPSVQDFVFKRALWFLASRLQPYIRSKHRVVPLTFKLARPFFLIECDRWWFPSFPIHDQKIPEYPRESPCSLLWTGTSWH